MSAFRVSADASPAHGIDREHSLSIVVDGEAFSAHPGDTIASARLADGRIDCGTSIYLQRPRGIISAGVEEPNALVTVSPRFSGDIAESMLPATMVRASDGLGATFLSGLGQLDPTPDHSRYEHKNVHVEVLVIGAGPAGLAAARAAAQGGQRVILVDEQSQAGGSLRATRSEQIEGEQAFDWAQRVAGELEALPNARVLTRTTAIGSYDANLIVLVEDCSEDLEHVEPEVRAAKPRQRIWHVRAGEVILATGAHERPLVFENNDRPGIMLAGAARLYLNYWGVSIGSRVAVATTNDAAYALVADLHAAGSEIAAVVDSRPEVSARARDIASAVGAEIRLGSAVVGSAGDGPHGTISSIEISRIDDSGTPVGTTSTLECDALAVSGGYSPVIHLHTQRQGKLRWEESLASFVPERPVDRQHIVGAAQGSFSLAEVLNEGTVAGSAAGDSAEATTPEVTAGEDLGLGSIRPLWLIPGAGSDPGAWNRHFVDFQRDQTVADVWRAAGAGMRGIEHIKRYTSISTANDQGKTSGVNAIGVIAAALGVENLGSLGSTSHRPPYTPVSFAAVAGRRRGELFDPARITSIHSWHVQHGAEFEDVGQWKRPWYYPQPGEDMDAAVLRECAAVRTSVGFQDASTLGKIEIRGTDAGEFLNRIYTNGFAKLGVGKARYGLMCTPDGMIFDDGVTLRLSDDEYYMTTTTGGAAKVLEWLEEWHQTEWPELDVVFTSVTEQWSTIAVVGPKSREVVAKLVPDLDVSNDAFPFMDFHETTLANGVPARICRISFSGELAFEINVATFYGLSTWEAVAEAGAEFNITPYGTETMHVLRAEKGFIIVGQDTDGTVTPDDAGMNWIVSKFKDFVGKRSFDREDTSRSDRKHLVGVLPVDEKTRLPEGAQLVAKGTAITPEIAPVPMIGHVTSSYMSAALGRPFGLALVDNGRERQGEIVQAPLGNLLVDVEITSPVLYDPEGKRRDG